MVVNSGSRRVAAFIAAAGVTMSLAYQPRSVHAATMSSEAAVVERVAGGHMRVSSPEGDSARAFVWVLDVGERVGVRVRICQSPLACSDFSSDFPDEAFVNHYPYSYLNVSLPGLGQVDVTFVSILADQVWGGCFAFQETRAGIAIIDDYIRLGAIPQAVLGQWRKDSGSGCSALADGPAVASVLMI